VDPREKAFWNDLQRLDPGWRRFVEWDIEVVACSTCKHYNLQGYKVCEIYPEGIPNEIFGGGGCEKFEHRDLD